MKSNVLRQLRTHSGLSLPELATLLQTDITTIIKWWSNSPIPRDTKNHIKKILDSIKDMNPSRFPGDMFISICGTSPFILFQAHAYSQAKTLLNAAIEEPTLGILGK